MVLEIEVAKAGDCLQVVQQWRAMNAVGTPHQGLRVSGGEDGAIIQAGPEVMKVKYYFEDIAMPRPTSTPPAFLKRCVAFSSGSAE